MWKYSHHKSINKNIGREKTFPQLLQSGLLAVGVTGQDTSDGIFYSHWAAILLRPGGQARGHIHSRIGSIGSGCWEESPSATCTYCSTQVPSGRQTRFILHPRHAVSAQRERTMDMRSRCEKAHTQNAHCLWFDRDEWSEKDALQIYMCIRLSRRITI